MIALNKRSDRPRRKRPDRTTIAAVAMVVFGAATMVWLAFGLAQWGEQVAPAWWNWGMFVLIASAVASGTATVLLALLDE